MDLKNNRILILAPHPDDEAIGCGGLICKAKTVSSEVFVLYFCVGKCRQLVTGHTEENIRLKEAENASKYANFGYKFAFIGDQFMRLDTLPMKVLIDYIEDEIEGFKPDMVLLPTKNSYDQDHRAVFNAGITALRPTPRKIRHFVKTILEYEEPYSWCTDQPVLLNFYLDITDFIDQKIELLSKHLSQIRDDPFPRSIENLKRLAGIRGAEAGIKYAEGFYIRRICD